MWGALKRWLTEASEYPKNPNDPNNPKNPKNSNIGNQIRAVSLAQYTVWTRRASLILGSHAS